MADKKQNTALNLQRTKALSAKKTPPRYSVGVPRKRERESRYVTKREMRGGEMHVPSNPPGINHQPWFQTVIVHSGKSGDITMKLSDLVSQLADQLDPHKHGLTRVVDRKPGPIINMRIRSIRAWNLSGRMIALSVDDFSDANKSTSDVDTLCGLVDTGSAAHIPAVGYELPESHKNIVLRNGYDASSDSDAVIYHIVSASTDAVIIYTNVYWKFDGPAQFSAFHNQMLASVQQIERSTSQIENNLSVVREKAEEGDHGDVFINGVKKVAPYVIAAVAANHDELMADKVRELETQIKQLAVTVAKRDSNGSFDDVSSYGVIGDELA